MSRRPILSEERRRRLVESQLARTHTRTPRRLARVVERNIATLCEIRQQMEDGRRFGARLADAITRLAGSMWFAWVHAAWFCVWLVWNLHLTPLKHFDPYPFGLLTMIVSLEAIFLSIFVLISQNREAEIANQRADLDLQINLLAEYEITRVLELVDAIADHLGLEAGRDPEVEELKSRTSPDEVLEEMQKQNRHGGSH